VTFNLLLPSASALSILAAGVWLVLTGRLVPREQLNEVRADRDKAVSRADAEVARWRAAYEYSEQARRIDAGHTGQLLANTSAVVAALPAPAGAGEPAGGSDAAALA
jgi:hypothetical protein